MSIAMLTHMYEIDTHTEFTVYGTRYTNLNFYLVSVADWPVFKRYKRQYTELVILCGQFVSLQY